MPAISFSEYAPEPNPETKKKDVVWFALNEVRPLFAFAGIWAEFKGALSKVLEGNDRLIGVGATNSTSQAD